MPISKAAGNSPSVMKAQRDKSHVDKWLAHDTRFAQRCSAGSMGSVVSLLLDEQASHAFKPPIERSSMEVDIQLPYAEDGERTLYSKPNPLILCPWHKVAWIGCLGFDLPLNNCSTPLLP